MFGNECPGMFQTKFQSFYFILAKEFFDVNAEHDSDIPSTIGTRMTILVSDYLTCVEASLRL